MEERLLELIKCYKKSLDLQITTWNFMGKTREGHPDFVLNVFDKLVEQTVTYKQEIEFLMSLKQI